MVSIDKRIEQLDQEMADLLRRHEDQVQRLAEVPVLGADSAQQIIAESAEVNNSGRSPHGNRHMRRILNQAANSAVKLKGSIFEILYRRYAPRLVSDTSTPQR